MKVGNRTAAYIHVPGVSMVISGTPLPKISEVSLSILWSDSFVFCHVFTKRIYHLLGAHSTPTEIFIVLTLYILMDASFWFDTINLG